ncbi:uncharacterized protein [Argopecten irradians]|uniref:uncharacterized protein isoform X2 n=1 Tax=Argopecten irradians TaxID=31199 RepID=UPI00371940AB
MEKSIPVKTPSTKERKNEYYLNKRKALKENDQVYLDFKIQDAARKRLSRSQLSSDQKKKNAESSKIRMRKMRERKKLEGEMPTSQVKTRREREKLRSEWRSAKQKQRSKMTPQAKRRDLERRREKYRMLKLQTTIKHSASTAATPDKDNPATFADKIESDIQNATPRKRDVLKHRGILNSPKTKESNRVNTRIVRNLTSSLKKMKRDQTSKGRMKYRWVVKSIADKYTKDHKMRLALDIGWHFWRSASLLDEESPCEREGAKESAERKKSVRDFYLEESTTLPGKRTVNAKTLVQKVILNKTTAKLHKEFMESKGKKVSLSTFQKLRPKQCLTVSKIKFNSCLCEYCANVELKLSVLKDAAKQENLAITINDKYDLCSASMCTKTHTFNNLHCVRRKCDQCGVHMLKGKFAPLTEIHRQLKWKKWENGSVTDSTSNAGKTIKRKILVEKSGSVQDCISEIVEEAASLTEHLFVARWQYNAFRQLKESLPENMLLTVADFSENYKCGYQDEIQSAYYSYQQVSLHPVVAYYKCPTCKSSTVEESAVFISPDIKHDAYAVNQFNYKMKRHIQERGVSFNHDVQFSDGCASQYKSKIPFQHLAERGKDGNIYERGYFGSRHGKGPCDALGGVVKKAAELYVRSRQGIIQNAQDFYNFCKGNMTIDNTSQCEHKKRVFFFEERINRETTPELRTIKGTQQLHSVRSVRPGLVKVRKLSCFCRGCLNDGECQNQLFVDHWETHNVLKQPSTKKMQGRKSKPSGLKTCDEKSGTGKQEENGNQDDSVPHKEDRIKTKRGKKVTKGKKYGKRRKQEQDGNPDQSQMPHTEDGIKTRNEEQDGNPDEYVLQTDDEMKARRDFFRKKLHDLQTAEDFDMLQMKCVSLNEELTQTYPSIGVDSNVSAVSNKLIADKVALGLLPVDELDERYHQWIPVKVGADGNCFPRSASVVAFGDELAHVEMRTRIVIEMCMGIDEYTNNNFLNKGIVLPTNEANHLLNSYTMFSEMYTPGEKITPLVARRIFELEAMNVRAGGSYMGIWQIFALSSVLNCNILSLYPKCGAALPRCVLNRTIIPRKIVNRENGTKTALFLWTSTRSDMVMENWIPNHFVPLVCAMSQPESGDSLFDEEDLSISLGDSMLEDLLQSLNDEDITKTTNTDQDQAIDVFEVLFRPESTDATSPGNQSSIPLDGSISQSTNTLTNRDQSTAVFEVIPLATDSTDASSPGNQSSIPLDGSISQSTNTLTDRDQSTAVFEVIPLATDSTDATSPGNQSSIPLDGSISQSTNTLTDRDQSTAVFEVIPLAQESTDATSPGNQSSIPFDGSISQSTNTLTDRDQSTAVVEVIPLAQESTDDSSPGNQSSIPVKWRTGRG